MMRVDHQQGSGQFFFLNSHMVNMCNFYEIFKQVVKKYRFVIVN